jgi:hypothetical protein
MRMPFSNPIFLEIVKIFGYGDPELQTKITDELLKIEKEGLTDVQRDAIYSLMIIAFDEGKEQGDN